MKTIKNKILLVLVFILTICSLFGCKKDPTTPVTNEYELKYYLNNEVYQTAKVEASTVTLLDVSGDGIVFSGWYLDEALTNGPVKTYEVSANTNFYGTRVDLVAKIDSLSDTVTLEDHDEIMSVFNLYNTLNVFGKNKVSNRNKLILLVNTLTELETITANMIIEAIEELGTVTKYNYQKAWTISETYETTTTYVQEKVSNFEKLAGFIEEANAIDNKLKALEIEDLINNITFGSTDDYSKIRIAHDAYNHASDEVKALVSNASSLTQAINRYNELTNSENKALNVYYSIQKLPFSLNYDEELMNQAELVISAYNQLSAEEKSQVANNEMIGLYQEQISYYQRDLDFTTIPDYNYVTMDDFIDCFIGEFYKFLIENNHKQVLVDVGINSVSDFRTLFLSEDIVPSTISDLFNDQLKYELPTNATLDSFIGYMYKNGRMNLSIDYLYVLAKGNLTLSKVREIFNHKPSHFVGVIDGTTLPLYEITNIVLDKSNPNRTVYQYQIARIEEDINALNALVIDTLLEKALEMEDLTDHYQVIDEIIVSQDYADYLNSFDSVTKYDEFVTKVYEKINSVKLNNVSLADALVATSYAFYYQGTQIEYDQHDYRRNINIAPEEATSENILFQDCSSFANNAYYQTFGVNIHGVETKYSEFKTATYRSWCLDKTHYDVLFYDVVSNYTTEAQRSALIEQIKGFLQPGDMYVYQHDNKTLGYVAGHIMIYVGDGMFIHSTGTSNPTGDGYDPHQYVDKVNAMEETYGSVLCQSWDVLFDKIGNRYIFANNSEDAMKNIGFFRPLLLSGIEPTATAKNRSVYPGLSYEMKASVNNLNSVLKDQEITYTIMVKNNREVSYDYLMVEGMVPEHTTFVESADGGRFVEAESKVYFTLPQIKANASYAVSYTVKVNSDTANSTKIINNNSKVNNIKLNTLTHFVGKTIEEEALITAAQANSKQTYTTYLDFVRNTYNAVGLNVFSGVTGTNGSDLETVSKSILNSYKLTQTSEYYPMLISYLGYYVGKTNSLENNRARRLTNNQLQIGDVIICENKYASRYELYLYMGEDCVYSLINGHVELEYSTTSEVKEFLDTAPAYRRVAVLRPSLKY